MEEADTPEPVLGERLEGGVRDLHVLKVGTVREFLSGPGLPQVKEEPEEGPQQLWEDQWQALLKAVASPPLQGILKFSGGSEAKDFQPSSDRATAANQRPGGEGESHRPLGLDGETLQVSGRLGDSSGTAKEEMVDEENALVPFAKEEELENLVKTEQLPLSSVEAEPIGHDSDGEATLKGKKSEA
ncbi:UNVERIFIED_CONTAM: hypothetical protein K2H54_059629 [Gekko kuhli]